MSLAPGVRLGPYEIVSQLGKGGMGEVYRARDTRLGRDVAIKVIRGDTALDAAHLARFEHEARAVAALNHPNILALHDIGNADGIVYAVMEMLEGETLRDRLDRGGRLTVTKTLDFAIQMARGLAAAHERGFIHRDLKPENLFITQEGRLKILDFGLAQQDVAPAHNSDDRVTRFTTGPGLVMGTPGYIAPEQMFGESATSRSDLFAFGVVVHEMLTGSHPFARQSLTDTATAILRDDPPPLGSTVAGLPVGVAKILERCLQKQAADRPGSARDLALYLEAIGATADGPAGQPIAAAEVRRFGRRALAASSVLLLVLAAAPWIVVRVLSGRAVTTAIDADLTQAEQLVRRVQRDRFGALSLTARLIASFPELKALFATDAATVRDYLVSYQQRNPGVPLLIALSADSKVIARTDTATPDAKDEEWIGALLGGHGEPLGVQIGGRPHHAAAAAVEAGGNLFGYVVGAAPVDAEFAAALREATQDEILLLSNTSILASTLRSPPPWRTRGEWRAGGRGADRAASVSIGAQQFVAREVALVDRPPVSAVVLKSRDDTAEPFGRILTSLVVVGILGAVAAAIGGAWMARAFASAIQRR